MVKENVVYIHNKILHSHENGWGFVIHNNMDGLIVYYAKWNFRSRITSIMISVICQI